MKKKSLFIFTTLLLSFTSWGQNLVPNPSFEEYSECPNEPAQTYFLNHWSININTADYFNKCSSSEYVSIPFNSFGYQFPKDTNCNAYVGFWAFRSVSLGYQEYIGTKLKEPLIEGERYFISFNIILANDFPTNNCAVNKLGVLFTNYNYGNCIINYPDLMTNNFAHFYSEEIINDATNWISLKGSFIADSSYQYVLIGKFFNNENTSIICNESSHSDRSYYYLDDVCVSTDSAYCWDYNFTCSTNTSTDITNNYSIDIFPNPAENYFHIEIDKTTYKKKPKIEIYTALGKLVHKQQLNEINTKINTTGLKSGLYFVKIYCSNCNSVKKLIIK